MKKKNKKFKISYYLRKFYSYQFIKFFFSESFIRKKIFKNIFDSGYWIDYDISSNKSRSGKGSSFENTLQLQIDLKSFFKKNNIKKILDVGCGDFNWMSKLLEDIDFESYCGVDIVEKLIDQNKKKYRNNKIKFICKDFINDDFKFMEDFDFILIRHVFIHLKDNNINNILDKIKATNIQYVGITSDPLLKNNFDLKTEGRFREINFTIKPFNLGKPFQVLRDIDPGRDNNVDLNIYDFKKFTHKI